MIVALSIACASLLVAVFCLYRVMRLEMKIDNQRNATLADNLAGGGSAYGGAEEQSEQPVEERYHPFESDDETFMARLTELIDENLGNHDLNVDFLATRMMVSRSLLFNRVRRATGRGIVEFVNGIRIERSIEMFPDDSRSLTEIAELTGFSTLRYYSRVFKSLKGEIPSTYRERVLAGKGR